MKCKLYLFVFLFVVILMSSVTAHAFPPADLLVAQIMNANVFATDPPPPLNLKTEVEIELEGTVITQSVNIRSGPGLDFEIVGTVTKDEKLVLTAYHSDGWYEFSIDDRQCWIYAWFIHVPGEPVCIGTLVEDKANLRESPGMDSQVLMVLEKDTELYIHARDEDYYLVEAHGTLGWILGKYVDTMYKTIGLAIVKGDTVNIRVFPDLGAAVAEIAEDNQIYVTYGSYNGWYRLMLKDGSDAWIKDDFVEFAPYLSPVQSDYPALNVLEPPSGWEGMKLIQQLLINTAKKYMGVPYVWGGESPKGMDCSGFTLYVYKDFGVRMSHFAATQATYGKYVPYGSLRAGDLVFFAGSGSGAITHVGIYIGNNEFIHASSSKTYGKYVRISELTGYYMNTYKTARRIFDY